MQQACRRRPGGAASTSDDPRLSHTATGLSYRIVGRGVHLTIEHNAAAAIDAAILDEAAGEFLCQPLRLGDDFVRQHLDPRRFVEAHASNGGTAPSEVRRMLQSRTAELQDHQRAAATLSRALTQSQERLTQAVAQFLALARV